LELNPSLPALRIMPLIDRTFGPPTHGGKYALVVNWDPQDPSFDLNDKSIKDGEHGKFFHSWTSAYNAAVAVIEKVEKHAHRKALLRGLTPIPLLFLSIQIEEWEIEFIGTGIGATYGWQFLHGNTGGLDVEVNERTDTYIGIHNNRSH